MQRLECKSCGAPLSDKNLQKRIVICEYCGTRYQPESVVRKGDGGVRFGRGTRISVGGDIIGRDKIVIEGK